MDELTPREILELEVIAEEKRLERIEKARIEKEIVET